jgi:hypothetical protein
VVFVLRKNHHFSRWLGGDAVFLGCILGSDISGTIGLERLASLSAQEQSAKLVAGLSLL